MCQVCSIVGTTWLTPKERPRFCRSLQFQVSGNRSHRLDRFGAGSVTGEQDIKVGEVGLLEAGIDIGDFGGGGAGAFELLIACVIALIPLISGVFNGPCGQLACRGKTGILKCTVFSAATSQPSACITKAAIVLPTYLLLD